MPVLRQAPDNTLSETLGNLGSSLTNAFNPLNTIRAQNLQSEIQQRNWEIQQKQSIDAANKNAANVFYNSDLPFDPATKEMIAAGLRSGTLNVNNYIDALKATGSLKANQTASTMYAAAHADLPPEELASDQAELLAGRKTASELDAQRATTTLTTAKTGAALGAQKAAVTAASAPGMDAEAAPLAGSLALTDPGAVEKNIIAPQRARVGATTMPADTSQFSPVVTETTQRQLEAGQTPTLPAQIKSQAIATETGQKIAGNIFGPHPADQPVTGGTVDASGNVTIAPPVSSGGPPAPAPAPVSGTVAVTPAPADVSSIAKSKSTNVAAEEGTKFRLGSVLKDVDSGTKAATLLRTVALMREYANELDNNTPWNQAKSDFMNRVFEGTGMTFTAGQSAREAFTQISKQLMGAARTDDGIQRVAGPEITVLNSQMPNAQQDRPSLMRALDNLEMKARRLMDEGKLAGDLYGSAGEQGISAQQYQDYVNKKNAIEAPPTANKPVGTADTTVPTNVQTQPPVTLLRRQGNQFVPFTPNQ